MKFRINRWAIAITAVVVEFVAFVVWRMVKRRQTLVRAEQGALEATA